MNWRKSSFNLKFKFWIIHKCNRFLFKFFFLTKVLRFLENDFTRSIDTGEWRRRNWQFIFTSRLLSFSLDSFVVMSHSTHTARELIQFIFLTLSLSLCFCASVLKFHIESLSLSQFPLEHMLMQSDAIFSFCEFFMSLHF